MKHRVLRWPCLLLLAGGFVECARAIDINPPDGLSDVWVQIHSAHGQLLADDPNADDCSETRVDNPDRDGFYTGGLLLFNAYTNKSESLMGTDPFDSNSAMPSAEYGGLVVVDGQEMMTIVFPTVVGKLYCVEVKETVAVPEQEHYDVVDCYGESHHVTTRSEWALMPGAEHLVGDGQQAVVYFPPLAAGQELVYHLRCLGDLWSDPDQLSDWEESILGTNKALSDSELDGMNDDYEWVHELNPLVNDAGLDRDGDSIVNSQDSRPNDAASGAMAFQLTTPLNSSIIP